MELEKSTVLLKTRRYRICDKNLLSNVVNHILRNYKPETIQYKRDFNADDTKINLIIGSDYQIKEKGEDWFNEVELEASGFKELLNQSLIDADNNEDIKISLSRSEKDLTIKSISYFAKCENYTEEESLLLLKVSNQCLDFKLQKQQDKDYSVIEREDLQSALDFYENPPENLKIKSLGAKKKHLNRMLETLDKMAIHNDKRPTASARSIGFEEILFKIPKHNEKSLKDVDMIEIIKDWNNTYFSNFKVLGGSIHKDERTKKGNEVDDHLHLIRSGFNQETKRFDLPDFTHQLGLKLAQKQGLDFVADGKKYNDTIEENRTIASEALQTEFYRFANERLAKLGYTYRFEKKELTPEEIELRAFLKEQSHLPKAKRKQNLASFYEEKANENIIKANKANNFINKKNQELSDIRTQRNENVKISNEAISKKKEINKYLTKATNKLSDLNQEINEKNEKKDGLNELIKQMTNWLNVDLKEWYSNLIDGVLNRDKEKIAAAAIKHNEIESYNKMVADVIDEKIENFDESVKQIYKAERKGNKPRPK